MKRTGTVRIALRAVGRAAAMLFTAYLLLLTIARPWQRHWGANADERLRALPGDEHAGNPKRAGDRAIAIDAPAPTVWAWLVQMGQDRGGFYSYAGLENACGVTITNADRIHPEWQGIEAGDFVRATPPTWLGGVFGDRIGWDVDQVVVMSDRDAAPERHVLALRYWIFEVESVTEQTSRLHIRTHAGEAPVPIAPLLFLTFEPAHFIMERGMLIGIKARAERKS